jgi:hypothetical protein
MQSSFAGDAAYVMSSDNDQFTITHEDVATTYFGSMLFSTSSTSSGPPTSPAGDPP